MRDIEQKQLAELGEHQRQWKDGLLSNGEMLLYGMNAIAIAYAVCFEVREAINAEEHKIAEKRFPELKK